MHDALIVSDVKRLVMLSAKAIDNWGQNIDGFRSLCCDANDAITFN